MTEKTKFRIEIRSSCELSIEQIWPDGNAPENPTIEDVRELLDDVDVIPGSVISKWNLPYEVDVIKS